ncbi:hypothetical protein Tco_0364373 [Tanacetum coccineum]
MLGTREIFSVAFALSTIPYKLNRMVNIRGSASLRRKEMRTAIEKATTMGKSLNVQDGKDQSIFGNWEAYSEMENP